MDFIIGWFAEVCQDRIALAFFIAWILTCIGCWIWSVLTANKYFNKLDNPKYLEIIPVYPNEIKIHNSATNCNIATFDGPQAQQRAEKFLKDLKRAGW